MRSEMDSAVVNSASYVMYGDERLEFACAPRKGSSCRVMIKVYPDCRVVVHVPPGTPNDDVYDAVKKRGFLGD